MSSSDQASGAARAEAEAEAPHSPPHEGYQGLPIGSYTDQKLVG
jgi:hypothetical protein